MRRISGFILTLALVVGSFPAAVFAGEGDLILQDAAYIEEAEEQPDEALYLEDAEDTALTDSVDKAGADYIAEFTDETGIPAAQIADSAYSDTGYYIATFDTDEDAEVPSLDGSSQAPLSASVPYTTDQAVIYQRMIAMMSDYPEGTPWTDSDKYSWHNIYYPEGSTVPYSIYTGGGCVAFSMILSDAAFGDMPAYAHKTVIYDDLKVGDILRINNNTHTVIILEKSDEGVTIAEGNYNKSIHWGRFLDRSKVESADYYVTRYVETYTCTFETNGGSPIEPQTVVKNGFVTEPEPPVKSRYKFEGWYRDAELDQKWKFKTDKVNSNITLYAKWKVDEKQLLSSVELDKESLTLGTDESGTLSAAIAPGTSLAEISWSVEGSCVSIKESSDKRSVTVTPVSIGTAAVIATAVEKLDNYEITKTATAKVFVKRAGGELTATIVAGEQLDASNAFFEGRCPASDFMFRVSSAAVSVDKKGILKAKQAGEAVVVAVDKYDGAEYDKITLTILPKPVIKFNKTLTYEGQTLSVYDCITNVEDGSKYSFVGFTSSKPEVATVSEDGTITASAAGKTTIKVFISQKGKNGAVKDYSVKATVKVAIPKFAKESYNIKTGQELVISMKNVKASSEAAFTSSDISRMIAVGQRDKNGLLTGKAVIKGLVADNDDTPVELRATIDGRVYTCNVYITRPTIAKQAVKVKVGGTTTVSLKNTKFKKNDIVWKSSDENIATVEAGGKVRGKSKGSVIIYTETGGVRNECSVTVY
ncbi:MAG: InlB B-repeat-containing protein [Lachnospiraceae bacterium]|nr:InlB B-repeat-containing protein [Lachnospiraceae bacterium]